VPNNQAALPRKVNLLGVLVSATDYSEAVARVIEAASDRRSLTVSACAVHAVMEGHLDPDFGAALNTFDILAPDGQPVRWGMRWTRQAVLEERVYGPTLMLRVCEQAARKQLPIYLYGSTLTTLERLRQNLTRDIAGLQIAGMQPSRFRESTAAEQAADAATIIASGARVVFVGLGCPRQEWWVFHQRARIALPLLAVGAAFDFHAGTLAQAPAMLQRAGLEWAFRLAHEPRRLWRRYARLNPLYLLRLCEQLRDPERFPPVRDLGRAEHRPCPG
jgi:N-acetylglucosaminyldiphosphoundecaprenol N-acetyl-beta-D-mannosaminyltransferase